MGEIRKGLERKCSVGIDISFKLRGWEGAWLDAPVGMNQE